MCTHLGVPGANRRQPGSGIVTTSRCRAGCAAPSTWRAASTTASSHHCLIASRARRQRANTAAIALDCARSDWRGHRRRCRMRGGWLSPTRWERAGRLAERPRWPWRAAIGPTRSPRQRRATDSWGVHRGLCFGASRAPRSRRAEVASHWSAVACLVWFAFGAAMLRPALSSPTSLVPPATPSSASPGAHGPGRGRTPRRALGWATVAFMAGSAARPCVGGFRAPRFDELGHSLDPAHRRVGHRGAQHRLPRRKRQPTHPRYVSHISTREPAIPSWSPSTSHRASAIGAGMTARDARPT